MATSEPPVSPEEGFRWLQQLLDSVSKGTDGSQRHDTQDENKFFQNLVDELSRQQVVGQRDFQADERSARARTSNIGQKRDEGREELFKLMREGRRDRRDEVFLSHIRSGTKLQKVLAYWTIGLTFLQVIVTNIAFFYVIVNQVQSNIWPSDKLILGWFGATVVEIIGLHAIVLRGMFPTGRYAYGKWTALNG